MQTFAVGLMLLFGVLCLVFLARAFQECYDSYIKDTGKSSGSKVSGAATSNSSAGTGEESSGNFFSKTSDSRKIALEGATEATQPEVVTYSNRVVTKGLVPINWSGIRLEPYELTFRESSRGEREFNFIACNYKSHTSIRGIDGNLIKANRVTFSKQEGYNSYSYNAGTPDYSTASGNLDYAPRELREAFNELLKANGF